jgi:hypothetical protein
MDVGRTDMSIVLSSAGLKRPTSAQSPLWGKIDVVGQATINHLMLERVNEFFWIAPFDISRKQKLYQITTSEL